MGSVVITTDAAPMNEIDDVVDRLHLSTLVQSFQHFMGTCYQYSRQALASAVGAVLALSESELAQRQYAARQLFLARDVDFRRRFTDVLEAIERRLEIESASHSMS